MPFALFCNDAKLSKAYPTEADVWKQARQCGLVVDATTDKEKPSPRPVLDNDYVLVVRTRRRIQQRTRQKPKTKPRRNLSSTARMEARFAGSASPNQGVAVARDACSDSSVTQALLR
jgi:hypothetical protein